MARRKKAGDTLGKVFGLGIKRVRQQQGMKQEALAFEAGYGDRSQIAKIETGRTVPSLDKALRLAEILDVPVQDFIRIGRGEVPIPRRLPTRPLRAKNIPYSPLSGDWSLSNQVCCCSWPGCSAVYLVDPATMR